MIRPTWKWGYNTNGCQDHPLDQALHVLAEMGYQSVAITLDAYRLNPFQVGLAREVARIDRLLRKLDLNAVIETGARYLLDPHHKHSPTLVSCDPCRRQYRVEFLKRAIKIASDLGCQVVSFWTGMVEHDQAGDRESISVGLDQSLLELLLAAERSNVVLALEPEPGMWIDTTAAAMMWIRRIDSANLALTTDIGHVHCLAEGDISEILTSAAPALRNVHIEDMRRGVHEHLALGTGKIDFRPILDTLSRVDYTGGLHVELSRHSHAFPRIAKESLEYLQCQCR